MKKIFTVLIATIVFIVLANAQAPQGLNYQAVAYNGTGTPVINQSISVRFSILDGSATGTPVYEETQNPTTDNTGLFSIVIGNGTVVSGTFNTINWGNGSKWLKTEIDITGGTSYLVMGTSQFMSVPYTLYANRSSFGSGSFLNPDGFNNVTPVTVQSNTQYTVPAGKNFYIPNISSYVVIDGDTISSAFYTVYAIIHSPLGAGPGSVVSSQIGFVGYLVDKTVDWKTFNLHNTSFTVPANKQFVITNYMGLVQSNILGDPGIPTCLLTLDGTPMPFGSNLTNSIIDENTVISTTSCASNLFINFLLNGYLKDK